MSGSQCSFNPHGLWLYKVKDTRPENRLNKQLIGKEKTILKDRKMASSIPACYQTSEHGCIKEAFGIIPGVASVPTAKNNQKEQN